MGSRIVDGEIDYLFFFTDPMTLQPHDTDVKALTRLAGVENIVFCCNRSTADHIISSPLFVDPTYERTIPDYTGYTKRFENKPVVAEAVESAKNGRKERIKETVGSPIRIKEGKNFTSESPSPFLCEASGCL